MPHNKNHHTLKPGKSKLHGMIQNIKHNPNAPYAFIRQIGVGAALLAPLPFGKSNMVKNMASFVKQSKKVPPISKNPFTGTTKQYIQRSVDNRLKNIISGNLKSSVKQFGQNQTNLLREAIPNKASIIGKEYRVGGKLYGHYTKEGKLTNKFLKDVPVVGKPGTTIKVPAGSKTKSVSYVNPRISMTAAERRKAGY